MQVELDYSPREPFKAFHQRKQRWACLVCHRRAGKTVAAVNELVVRALYTEKKNARFAYIAPFRQQAKQIAWVYLKEATRDFATATRESDLQVQLPNGAWITLYGSDNPDALRGIYLDGLVVDEFGDCRPNLWAEVLIPTLADREGWAVVSGTPRGMNQFHTFHELSKKDNRWFSLTLRASDSGLVKKEELERMRSVMSEAQYEQELECSFSAPVLGTYYAGIIEKLEKGGQISDDNPKWDPNFPVSVATDLGFTDSSAYWFWQIRPDGIAVIDHYEAQSYPLQHYLDMLDDKPYEYDTIWLPHDARAKTLQTGRSTAEQFVAHFHDTKTGLDIVPQLKVQHGIDAARLVLPHCHFNRTTCNDGIESLRAYRRKYNELTKSFTDKPLHDFSSDSSDAFRYMALVTKTALKLPANEVDPTKMAASRLANAQPNYGTLDQLFADHEKKPALSVVRMRI